jgi:tetraprenyl-beta-curcumene synthase
MLARTGLALVAANARYWPSVWPLVRTQLRRWEQRAHAIEDRELRSLALWKLEHERFNAEVAATLATLAPGPQRSDAVEAIVALELLFDYLDGLTERRSGDPLGDGEALFAGLRDAVDLGAAGDREYFGEHPGDGGYLSELSSTACAALARLPAAGAVAPAAQRAAALCSQAQVRKHAAATTGREQLESWARQETAETGLGWRELIAGAASSVLAIHALIAAAADAHTTPEQAAQLAEAYLLIGVLITALDSLIDEAEDLGAGEEGFVGLYQDHGQLAEALLYVEGRAAAKASTLEHAPHHVMTLAGVVAYYTSAPAARSGIARPIAEQLQRQLRPLILPTLAVMRTWRLAKRARRRLAGGAPRARLAD